MTTEQHKQLDNIILDELNVKRLIRPIMQSNKGEVCLVFDGKDYIFEKDGVDVTTDRLLEIVPEILSKVSHANA